MKFVNVTQDDAEKIGAKFRMKIQVWAFVIGGVLLSLFGIIMLIFCLIQKFYEPLAGGALLIVCGALFIIFGVRKKSFIKKILEKQCLAQSKTCAVVFKDDGFEVTCYAYRNNSGSFTYDMLTVTDYPAVWVLEYGENRWVTLNKICMTEGTWEQLSEFLAAKLAERYQREV